jgi:hypothetical protein
MAQDSFVGPKIQKEDGGDSIRFASGATLVVATGATFTNTAINRKYVSADYPSGTAGAAGAVTARLVAPAGAITVRAVTLQPSGTCAGHASNNFTLSVRNVGTGATGSTDIATLALTTGNALATNVPKAMTVSTTGGAAVAALESVVFAMTTGGTGIDFPSGVVTVEFTVDN